MSGTPRDARALDHWRHALAASWGIDARLELLAGEYDLNLRATTRDGRSFVLKVMRPGCESSFVELLCAVHDQVHSRDASLPVPAVVRTRAGSAWCEHDDPEGAARLLWLLTSLDGREYARVRPHALSLIRDVGAAIARLHLALQGFSHPGMHRRGFKWDLRNAMWIEGELGAVDGAARQQRLRGILSGGAWVLSALREEPVVVIHNDLNDWNLLVARRDDGTPCLSGILDFGDLIAAPVVAELAIAGAYTVLDHPHPLRALAALVAGYHTASPLRGEQLDVIWPLLLVRLAVSVTNSALQRRERPHDPYLSISEEPAWRFLDRSAAWSARLVAARLRAECGFPATAAAGRVLAWLGEHRGRFAPVMGAELAALPSGSLAVRHALVPRDPTAMSEAEARSLGSAAGVGDRWVGSYGEPRAVYTAPAFRSVTPPGTSPIADRRSVHLGVDVFLPAATPVHAPCDGVIETAEYRDARLDYGGMVVLRHATPAGDPFWTLYGHLSRASAESLRPGQSLSKGERFAELGVLEENGGWDPHLHFQLAMLTDGMEGDWPGVADPDDWALWHATCPNPAALLNLPDAHVAYRAIDEPALRAGRASHFASNLRLSYREPCLFVRGWKHYLYDEWGRMYLDAYNNVPHVGHAHPRLAAVAADQLARLNTNTRYLHPAQLAFAEQLLARMPQSLTHVFLVNSGSEGNELALRLARAHTGGQDMITPDHGYHGNTTGAYAISAYKFNKPGGGGQPEWVQLVPVADAYRGAHQGDDAAVRYAEYVDDAIARVRERNGVLAGFIAETFPSVAGQVIPPVGYLQGVYDRVRRGGGVCIADEVQTGLGRLGDHFWGFEQQQVVPDIVVLGKPLGNGHPMGAVVTTAAIARSFDNGIEFFSTFGGSTLSCRVGTEVLRIVREEGLQENARVVGDHLLAGLRELQTRHAAIGDVRGMGLFVGVELVGDREAKSPATRLARYVVNRLREERILAGTEGPADNVLKIRPPLTVGRADVEWLVQVLDGVLGEFDG